MKIGPVPDLQELPWCKPYFHQIILNFFWQIFFFLMLTKENDFILRNFLLLHKLEKEDNLTFASYYI